MGKKEIQLKKGVIEILILKLLNQDKMYGYQLLQELDNKSDGVFKMKEGTLYPVLYRLEDAGYITSVWEDSDSKNPGKRPMPRKYYQITESGQNELGNLISNLKNITKAVSLILEEEI